MSGKTRILVVVDDEVVRSSYVRSLQSTCDVEAAFDGDGALRAMEDESFDVVLLDLRMPLRRPSRGSPSSSCSHSSGWRCSPGWAAGSC
jgi:CheY-like chemotaxis protein